MAALTPDYAQVEAAVVEMTNTFRGENKLGAQRLSDADAVRIVRSFSL